MFNSGIRGRRARDGEGNVPSVANFVQKTTPAPFIRNFQVFEQDDLALDPVGGQTVLINGNGFESGLTLTLGGVSVSPVTVINSTQLSFTAPAKSAGTYSVLLVNPSGGSAVLVPGIVYSGFPNFDTAGGNIGDFYETTAISTSVSATADSNITYDIVSGSIPPGSTFSSSGTLTGTAPVEAASTTYTFTVRATDQELQESTREFNVTVNTDVVSWVYPQNNATVTINDAAPTINLSATSAAGYGVVYSVSALPQGLSLGDNGDITGTVSEASETPATLTATSFTTDRSSTISITWSVQLGDPFFNQTSLLLNSDANTFITDASNNAFTITPVGNTRPSAFSPYNGRWSNYFDGSGDYLIGSSSMLGGGSVNTFTIDGWVYPTLFGAQRSIIGDMQPTGGGNWISADISSTGQVILYWYDGNSKTCTSTSTMSLNTWNYFAIRVSNNAISIYVNSETASGLTGTTTLTNRGGTFNFALGQWTNSFQFNGHISNIRVSTVARTISIPTEPFVPDADTRILTCQSNRLIDNSTNAFTITKTGDVKVQSFGPFASDYRQDSTSYSVYFDGVDDYFYSTTPLLPSGSTNTFTIEGWFYTPSAPGSQYLIFADGNPTQNEFNIGVQLNSNRTLRFAWYTALQSPYGFDCATTGTANLNAWNWFAVVVNNNAISIYLNSTTPQGLTGTTTLINRGRIGYMMAGLYFSQLDYLGYISNIRVSTIARTITEVPTAPYEADANTRWLVAQSSTLIDNSGNNHNPIIAGNQCHIRTFNPFGYTNTPITDTTGSGYFDGTGDYLSVPDNAAFDLLSNENWTIECWFYKNTTGRQSLIGSNTYPAGQTNWVIEISPSDQLRFFWVNIAQTLFSVTSSSTVILNQWNHVAVSNNGGTVTLYVNGVSVATTTITGTYVNHSTGIAIGNGSSDGVSNVFNGYISDARIIIGTALYTTNFTPPASPLTAVSGTQLLTLQNRTGYNNSQPIDESGIKNVITRNGNASTGSFSPHVPSGWSGYFDGDGDYIQIADNPALNLGTGDFTIEAWIYWIPRSGSTFPRIMAKGDYQFSTGSWRIQLSNASGSMGFNYGSSDTGLGIGTLASNTWGHICIVRSGTTIKTYLNGVFNATIQSSVNYDSTYPVKIGAGENLRGGEAFNGYVSNLRILKGTALHTGGSTSGDVVFTPPTASLEPITNTSLLTLRGPAFTDDGPNRFAITRNGDTKITPFSPFAPHTVAPDSYSVYFDGSDWINTADNDDYNVGTGDFTVEFWMFADNSQQTYAQMCGQRDAAGFVNGDSPFGIYRNNNANNLAFNYWSGSTNVVATTTNAVYDSQWHHIALVRNGTDFRMYVDGQSSGFLTLSAGFSFSNSTKQFSVGRAGEYNGQYFTGYISNFRFVKGRAVYTSSFTPPTVPLGATSGGEDPPQGTETSLLTCQSPTVIDNSTNDFAITVNGNSQPTKFNPFGETATTGVEYSPTSHGGSVYFDGTDDYLSVPSNNAFVFGTGDFTIESWIYLISSQQAGIIFGSHEAGVATGYYLSLGTNLVYWGTYGYGGTNGDLTWSVTNPLGQWTHLAFVKSSSGASLFVNGQLINTQAFSKNISSIPYNPSIGADQDGNEGVFTGYFSNLRVIKGTALYTSAFVPPQAPVDPIPGTTLLTCNNNAAIQDKTGRNVLETVGNARTLPESPYRLNKSVYFDGTGDYLQLASNAAFNMNTYACIEVWVNYTALGTSTLIAGRDSSYWIGYNFSSLGGATNKFVFSIYNGSTWSGVSSTTTPQVNRWYHVVGIRDNSTLKIYVDGVLENTAPLSGTPVTTSNVLGIGANQNTQNMTGYVSNVRFVFGSDSSVLPYTSNFDDNLPTSPLTAVSGTSLLTCQSYNFKDNSTNDFTITRNGDAKISSRGPFTETQTSDNAMYFDGTGDYLVGYNLDSFAVGDFTVEAWVYFNANSSTGYSTIFAGSGLSFYVYNLARLDIWPGPSPVSQVNYTFSVGQWYHIVYARSNNTFYFYVNGTRITGANSSTIYTGSTFSIGGINSPTHYLNGYIDDLRVTKGVARYTEDFTPLNKAFPSK